MDQDSSLGSIELNYFGTNAFVS